MSGGDRGGFHVMLDVSKWVPDASVSNCEKCRKPFNTHWRRKHHCRRCGHVFCWECTKEKPTSTNRELVAQGVGNICSGLLGGLPITQVIVRSSANIQAGAGTKASAFFHGVLLLVCGLFLPKVLNLIPLASLAAILLMVGYKLAKPQIFVVMYSNGWSNFVPFSITILGIIFLDLLSGIGLGMVCALIHILWSHYKIPYNFTLKDDKADKKVVIQLAEHVSFLNKPVIIKTLEHLPNNSNVIIDASKSKTVHPDIVEIICDFRESAKSKNITFMIEGLSESRKHDTFVQFKEGIQNIKILQNRDQSIIT